MKKFFEEFKSFVKRGNVLNLSVGIIIGAAFQNVVRSLTEDIISPVIGMFTGQNFDSLKLELMGVTLKYGAFLTAAVNFLIMAFVIFLLVKAMNTLMDLGKPAETPQKAPVRMRECPHCLSSINAKASVCPMCTRDVEPVPEED